MTVQIIHTDSGEELVVISRRDYDALLARLGDEDAEDRMTLLLAAEARAEQPLPSEVSAAVLSGASLVKAVRQWRGLTQSALAEAAGINQGFVSEIESGAKGASPETLARLAVALGVPAGWLG
ncbi:helix-turn-helix domain-containing protein [Phreatobacter sp.]|uniref:helix-turn-helix domain-containing protein n=1 Tax=Phreatobacter sp. TaxID=1966341 RepID=UPI003F6E9FB1